MQRVLRVSLMMIGMLLAALATPAWADFAAGETAYRNQNYRTAMNEWRPLAEQGNAKAQFSMGKMYVRAHGVAKDYDKAAYWYRLAADQGHALSQIALASMYSLGRGVAKDYVQAYMWYEVAVAGGQKHVTIFRDLIAKEMTPDQIAEAQRLARDWKPKKPKYEKESYLKRRYKVVVCSVPINRQLRHLQPTGGKSVLFQMA